MALQVKARKVGDLRPSQLLYTFGIGSLLDLPHLSVIIMGLDDWDVSRCEPISEDRLLRALKLRLGSQVARMLRPPRDPDELNNNPFGPQIGVPVVPFPRWARCPRCDYLGRLDSGVFSLQVEPFHPERARYVHANCNKAYKPTVLPVRFVLACRSGHLEDFPWDWYVHHGSSCPKGASILRLREYGVSGEASDIVVECQTCGQKRRLGEAVGKRAKDVLPECQARHPHLRGHSDDTQCEEELRVTLLGASNSWFPVTLSVLHIPPLGDGKLAQLVDDHWAKLQKPRSQESIEDALEMGMFPAFSQYTAAEVWKAIEKKRAAESSGEEDEENLKMPEWRAFSNPGAQPPRSDFKLEEAPPPRGYEHLIERTVLVQRIREVRALMGFTRIESPGDFFDDTKVPEERRAPLSRNAPTWLPATEVRGEGLFIQFKHSTLSKWRNSSAVKDRELELFKAHRAWRAMRKIEPAIEGFPGIVYIAVHSLSHALMRQLSLECGYTAASIRERIYIRESDSASERMAGLLIYTAAPDSEGTLGGLVSLGDPDRLGALLDQALEHAKVCSSDPLCAEHDPVNALTVHGAACHGCLFAPETSCERGNKYLDRWTLVNTYASEGVGLVEQGV